MIGRILKPVVAVLAVTLAVWQVSLLLGVLHGAADAPEVDTAVAKQGDFLVGISREGAIESAEVVSLRAPSSGSTISWVTDDGVEVKKGDLIAKVDTGDYQFEVEQNRLQSREAQLRVGQEQRDRTREYESAQTDMDRFLRSLGVLDRSQLTERQQAGAQIGFDQWNLRWSEQDFSKQSRLSIAGIVPKTTVDQSERTLRSREYGLAKSEKDSSYLDTEHASKRKQSESDVSNAGFSADLAKRRIAEAVQTAKRRAELSAEQLAEMESELSGAEVRSPMDGVVILGKTWGESGRRTIKEGDHIWRRMTIAEVSDLTKLQVALGVDENSIHRVRKGQPAVITARTAPGRVFAGEVTSIGAVAHEVSPMDDPNAIAGQRVFDVLVTIAKPELEVMRPGVKAEVQFVAEKVDDALWVPLEAIFVRDGRKVVYVQQGARFVARPVTTGPKNDTTVVITEGLRPGDIVALTNPTRYGGTHAES